MNCVTIRLVIFALSMTFVAATVKAQEKTLPPVNPGGTEGTAKSDSGELAKLVQVLMATGADWAYPNGLAQVVGLERPMPAKVAMAPVGDETRKFHVIYETDATGNNLPVCIYLVRTKKTKHDMQERCFRVSLDGQLEKVITLRNKLDDQGKAMREGRSKVEEDINSPQIRKLFKTDLKFWLKDWLKKQQKPAAEAPAK